MLHPSYTDLMNVVNSGVEDGEQPTVNSRYSIVIAASKRARQLIEELGEEETAQGKCFKPLSMAVQELNDGEVKILSEDDIPEEEIQLREEIFEEEEPIEGEMAEEIIEEIPVDAVTEEIFE